jgi:hypothetical protein
MREVEGIEAGTAIGVGDWVFPVHAKPKQRLQYQEVS